MILVKKIFYFFFLKQLSNDVLVRSRFKDLFKSVFLGHTVKKTKRLVFIIVTSKTEVRVFKPFVDLVAIETVSFDVEIIFLKDDFLVPECWQIFSDNRQIPISISHNLNNLIKYRFQKSAISLVSLDFAIYPSAHALGIQVVNYVNSHGAIKSVCLQHGSLRDDNINGHLSSNSIYQFVFGNFMFNALSDVEPRTGKHIRVVGNPFFDRIQADFSENEVKEIKFENQVLGRSKILLASCMHTEYDHLPNNNFLYRHWLMEIIESIDYNKYYLIIKTHPYDRSPSVYKDILDGLGVASGNYEIISDVNFYHILNSCDILMTRASTTAEDGLILNKKVIAFDNVEEGPLRNYNFLKGSGAIMAYNKDQLKSGLKNQRPLKYKESLIGDIIYKFDGNNALRMLKEVDKIISE